MDFRDTEEREKIISEISEYKTPTEVAEFIQRVFPDWLAYIFDDYSDDYLHLKNNWRVICEQTGSKPQKIILVSEIKFDQEHSIIMRLCEYMTQNGYCVRRLEEFSPCPVCNKAIPTRPVWEMMRQRNLGVPLTWSDTCRNCKK
jgi:hypothetical protein